MECAKFLMGYRFMVDGDVLKKVRNVVVSGGEGFEEVALDLFEWQFERNLAFGRFCESLGKVPGGVKGWEEVPVVPTGAFKMKKFPVFCGDEAAAKRKFLTSGTTGEVRGVHLMRGTEVYDLSIVEGWKRGGLPNLEDFEVLFVGPWAGARGDSSLGHMFGVLGGFEEERFLVRNGRFELGRLYRAVESGQRVFLMGTALGFLNLMEVIAGLKLPEGSVLLETGGYKGTGRVLEKAEFYRNLGEFFGVGDGVIWNEYGMTELSSQAYATGGDGWHEFPGWCRLRVLDVVSGEEVEVGEVGYVVVYDLANVWSVSAIGTQDFAVRGEGGRFRLLGRDSGALPRGCSRTVDEMLGR